MLETELVPAQRRSERRAPFRQRPFRPLALAPCLVDERGMTLWRELAGTAHHEVGKALAGGNEVRSQCCRLPVHGRRCRTTRRHLVEHQGAAPDHGIESNRRRLWNVTSEGKNQVESFRSGGCVVERLPLGEISKHEPQVFAGGRLAPIRGRDGARPISRIRQHSGEPHLDVRDHRVRAAEHLRVNRQRPLVELQGDG